MPTISEFFGVRITMYFDDHGDPHFHARYAEYSAKIRIADGAVLRGTLPTRLLPLVREWAYLHQHELLENWDRARKELPLRHIVPLD
jgi:hypothetical protein